MEGVAWVFVAAAGVATMVALLVFLVPLGRHSGPAAAPRRADAPSGSPAGSLARGFSYLQVSPRSSVRRAGVHDRVNRAFRRIDAVDPHEAPRRIGEALLQAGLAEPGARPRPIDPPTTRPDRASAPSPREQP